MLLSALALVATPMPLGVTDEPYHLSISVLDEGWRDTITVFSRPVFAQSVYRSDLRCDNERTFCARTMDAYVTGSDLLRRVHISVREWDGTTWRLIASPVVTLPGGETETRLDVEDMDLRVTLGTRELESRTI